MAQKFYVGDYGGPLSVNVYAPDGETPLLPVSATIDIINMSDGSTVVNDGVCIVSSGLASYVIPEASPATATAGRYVGYITVLIEIGNKQTEETYYNVFEKTSYYILERWRAKVQDSALSEDHTDDDAAREWVDQAVDWIKRRFEDSPYASVLGAVDPLPTAKDMEFIASVASLMARTAWFAGRGTWRDDEMSYDARGLQAEWDVLDQFFTDLSVSGIYDTIEPEAVTNFNRDGVFYRGRYYDEPDSVNFPYYRTWFDLP